MTSAAVSLDVASLSTSGVNSTASAPSEVHEERAHVKERLALAIRIFGKLGYDEGVAGHITVRDPLDPTSFWVNPFGKAFSFVQPSDLLRVSHSGEVLEAGKCRLLNKAAFVIHSAIHSARPDVLCAAHSHSIYGRAFTTLGRMLDITSRESCAFYDDHVVHTDYKGVVLDEVEGIHIAETLGNKKAALLKNHGLLVATGSIEATVFFYKLLEEVCRVQLMSDAAAGGIPPKVLPFYAIALCVYDLVPQMISPEEAMQTWREVGSEEYGRLHGLAMCKEVQIAESSGGV